MGQPKVILLVGPAFGDWKDVVNRELTSIYSSFADATFPIVPLNNIVNIASSYYTWSLTPISLGLLQNTNFVRVTLPKFGTSFILQLIMALTISCYLSLILLRVSGSPFSATFGAITGMGFPPSFASLVVAFLMFPVITLMSIWVFLGISKFCLALSPLFLFRWHKGIIIYKKVKCQNSHSQANQCISFGPQWAG